MGTVRIVQTLVGDPAARPVGAMGDIAPGLGDTPSARAGLAVLAAARQWQFDPPNDAPLLIVTDVGVGDDVAVSPAEQTGAKRASDAPLPVGGAIKPPTKITDVPPVYPPEAIAARITGTVTIEAVIDPAGNVSSARVDHGRADAGRRGAGRGASVEVHADAGERRGGRRDHDRDEQVHAEMIHG